jgi:hypothetical protein
MVVEDNMTRKLAEGDFECIKDCEDPHVIAGNFLY